MTIVCTSQNQETKRLILSSAAPENSDTLVRASSYGRDVAIYNAESEDVFFKRSMAYRAPKDLASHSVENVNQSPEKNGFRPADKPAFSTDDISTFSYTDVIACFDQLKVSSFRFTLVSKVINRLLFPNSNVSMNQCKEAAQSKLQSICTECEQPSGEKKYEWDLSCRETASQTLLLALNLAIMVNNSVAYNYKSSDLDKMVAALWDRFKDLHGDDVAKSLLDKKQMINNCGIINDPVVQSIVNQVKAKLDNDALLPEFVRNLKQAAPILPQIVDMATEETLLI